MLKGEQHCTIASTNVSYCLYHVRSYVTDIRRLHTS